jgi:hypothetical protein
MIEEAMMGIWYDEILAIFRVNVMSLITGRNFVWFWTLGRSAGEIVSV